MCIRDSSFGDGPFNGRYLGSSPGNLPCKQSGKLGNLVVGIRRFERNINMYAGRTGGLGKRNETYIVSNLLHDQRDLQDVFPRSTFWIEINRDVVGFVQVLDGRMPWVLFDRAEIHKVNQRTDS